MELPLELEPPIVGKFDPNDQPVLWIPHRLEAEPRRDERVREAPDEPLSRDDSRGGGRRDVRQARSQHPHLARRRRAAGARASARATCWTRSGASTSRCPAAPSQSEPRRVPGAHRRRVPDRRRARRSGGRRRRGRSGAAARRRPGRGRRGRPRGRACTTTAKKPSASGIRKQSGGNTVVDRRRGDEAPRGHRGDPADGHHRLRPGGLHRLLEGRARGGRRRPSSP